VTQTWDCAEARISLGVYVLGAIDPAERAQVDAHVATCRDCRDELAGLAGIPALLARVSAEEITRIEAENTAAAPPPRLSEAPPELIDTVRDLAAARRRRTRWRYLAVAAAVVAVTGGVVGGVGAVSSPATHLATEFPTGVDAWDSAQGSNPQTGANLRVNYGQALSGTELAAQVTGIPPGVTCQMYVIRADGSRMMAGSWTTASDEGLTWYWGSAAGQASTITWFQLVAGGKVLVTAKAS
jgi:Putative zinc-finger